MRLVRRSRPAFIWCSGRRAKWGAEINAGASTYIADSEDDAFEVPCSCLSTNQYLDRRPSPCHRRRRRGGELSSGKWVVGYRSPVYVTADGPPPACQFVLTKSVYCAGVRAVFEVVVVDVVELTPCLASDAACACICDAC